LFLVSFLATPLAIYALIVLVPLAITLGFSITNLNFLAPDWHFVGLRNYQFLANDDTALHAYLVTILLTIATGIVPNIAGFFLAVILDRPGRAVRIMRVLFFVPQILSAIVVAFIWAIILTDDGILNNFLRTIGLEAIAASWLGNATLALFSVAAVASWQLLGFCTVVYLAALQTIPRELYDSAAMDGVGAGSRVVPIQWPLVAPAFTIVTLLLLIAGFKMYDTPLVLTSGGPVDATETVAIQILRTGLDQNLAGYASAKAFVLFFIVIIVTVVVLRLLQRRETDL
jgi:multiple sugar transport system permease protein